MDRGARGGECVGGPNQPRSAAEPTTGRGLIIYIYLIIYIDISRSLRARLVPVPVQVEQLTNCSLPHSFSCAVLAPRSDNSEHLLRERFAHEGDLSDQNANTWWRIPRGEDRLVDVTKACSREIINVTGLCI